MSDLISIIVPCYNVENYILRCLRSIEVQSYGLENIELILIDDASTDNTLSLLNVFYQKHPQNVTVIPLIHNGKQGAARNKGMDIATGKYLMFVDADDMLHPDALKKMHAKITEYDCDEVRCSTKCFSSEDELTDHVEDDNGYFADLSSDYERKNFILASMSNIVHSRLFRREVFEKNHIRFMEDVFYEDAHFSGICCFYINRKYWMAEELYFYFRNPESTMSVFSDQKNHDHIKVCQRLIDELKERGIYDEVMAKYYHEFNAYCCWTVYLNSAVLLRDHYYSQLEMFKRELLKHCPDILENAYVMAEHADIFDFLK